MAQAGVVQMVQMVQTKPLFYSLPNISVLSILIFLNESEFRLDHLDHPSKTP